MNRLKSESVITFNYQKSKTKNAFFENSTKLLNYRKSKLRHKTLLKLKNTRKLFVTKKSGQ